VIQEHRHGFAGKPRARCECEFCERTNISRDQLVKTPAAGRREGDRWRLPRKSESALARVPDSAPLFPLNSTAKAGLTRSSGTEVKIHTALRIVADELSRSNFREFRHAVLKKSAQVRRLFRPLSSVLAHRVLKNHLQFWLNRVRPVNGEVLQRARAAVDWLLTAQNATPDHGISLGYFPCDEGSPWRPSYPETSGYIIPSLLRYGEVCEDRSICESALKIAEWETQIQMESGAVQAGPVCVATQQVPAIFNTGMVLEGWGAAYRFNHAERFLRSARRAADFIVADMNDDGHLQTHGPFVAPHPIKTYNVLCAVGLYQHGQDTGERLYKEAAIRITEAAISKQQRNGWFANNCLTDSNRPLLHTIGYALQGILEVGILADRPDFVEATRRGTDPLLERIGPAGFLHGRYYADWEPAGFSSCLTGSAQLAVVCYRLFEYTGEKLYRLAADRILNFLKALQTLDSGDPCIDGAIAGSFPLLGSYMSGGYPNWATRFFLDGLMLQYRLSHSRFGVSRLAVVNPV
jgi:hypothetical protein